MDDTTAQEIFLLVRHDRATTEERAALDRWRRQSSRNEAKLRSLEALWDVTGALPEVDPTVEVPSSLMHWPPGRGEGPVARRVRGRAWGGWAAAAALVAGVAIGYHLDAGRPPVAAGDAEFHTSSGEMATAALPDGSIVRLAPDTRLRVTLGPQERAVWLEGRAFFAVVPESDRPFVVRTGDGEARVVGTRFDIDARARSTEVLVVDGLVAIRTDRDEVHLGAGDLGRTEEGSVRSVRQVEDPVSHLSWLGSFMAFESTPLHLVVREVGARLGVRMELTDPSLATRTVTGWFARQDGYEVADMICRVTALTCERVGEVVVVAP